MTSFLVNSPGGAVVKNLFVNASDSRDAVLIPRLEDPLKKEMGTHSNILAWKIPWTEEPGRLQYMASQSQTHLPMHTSQWLILSISSHLETAVYYILVSQ